MSEDSVFKTVRLALAPRFSGGAGQPSRMCAVIEAARSGNRTLIRLSLENLDKYGHEEGPFEP